MKNVITRVSREIKRENGKRFQTKAKSHEMKRGPKHTKPRSIVLTMGNWIT